MSEQCRSRVSHHIVPKQINYTFGALRRLSKTNFLTIKNSESFANAILSLHTLRAELHFETVTPPADIEVAWRGHHLAVDTRVRRGLELELGIPNSRSMKHMIDERPAVAEYRRQPLS